MKQLLLLPLLRYPTLIGLDRKLEALSKEGKNMDPMGMQNSLLLTLFPTQRRDFRFAVDYNKNALPSYRGEWESCGWELCARLSGYFIWRIANNGKEPRKPARELLTARRRKLAQSFLTCALLFLAAALILAIGVGMIIANGYANKTPIFIAEIAVIFVVAVYFFWSSRKMKSNV